MSVRCQKISLVEGAGARMREPMAILIPAYNEAEHLEALIARCLAVKPALVLVVDDASTDRSALLLQKLAAQHGDRKVHVLRNEQNLGKQGTVRRGLRYLRELDTELVGVALIDGDLQHDPAELPALCDLLSEYDVVIGARSQVEMPLNRRFSNMLVNVGYALIGGIDFVDVQSGLRIYRMEQAMHLAEELKVEGGYGIEHESLVILARNAQHLGDELRIAAASISCAYGAASSIKAWHVVELALQTMRQALALRRYQRSLPVALEAA